MVSPTSRPSATTCSTCCRKAGDSRPATLPSTCRLRHGPGAGVPGLGMRAWHAVGSTCTTPQPSGSGRDAPRPVLPACREALAVDPFDAPPGGPGSAPAAPARAVRRCGVPVPCVFETGRNSPGCRSAEHRSRGTMVGVVLEIVVRCDLCKAVLAAGRSPDAARGDARLAGARSPAREAAMSARLALAAAHCQQRLRGWPREPHDHARRLVARRLPLHVEMRDERGRLSPGHDG